MNKYSILKSRKFWAALVGLLYSMIYCVWPDFPIPEESVVGVVATVVSYILGVALEDGLSRSAATRTLMAGLCETLESMSGEESEDKNEA